MVLEHLKRPIDYDRLLRLLQIKSYGAPASNIRLLTQLDFSVTYGVTDMAGMENMLTQGHPVIIFVHTGELPYWNYNSDHALVVVGFDENSTYVNDPYFLDAPLAVSKGEFELAWLERDYYYALITL